MKRITRTNRSDSDNRPSFVEALESRRLFSASGFGFGEGGTTTSSHSAVTDTPVTINAIRLNDNMASIDSSGGFG